MNKITISSEVIELYKIIKYEGLASSGAEAKALVADGRILVNGGVETRKRKKIGAGDVVKFDGVEMQVEYDPQDTGA